MVLYSRNSISLLSILIFLGLIFSPIFLYFEIWEARADVLSTSVSVIITVCGNGVIESGEVCDDGIHNGQYGFCKSDCSGLGPYCGDEILQSDYEECDDGNNISGDGCDAVCKIEEAPPPPPPSGGGGGWIPPPTATKVIIKGIAYPLSHVTVIEDGRVAITTIADSQANFRVEITDITAGVWTFGIWAEDNKGRKSITFSFTTSVTSGMTTTISGIFLPPTIDLSKTIIQSGETLNILGQTSPESDITISISSDEIIKKTTAQADGTWFYGFDTTPLEEGSHSTRAKATSLDGSLSTFSNTLAFYIGEGAPGVICAGADLNGDGKTNLVDFSILLYWWGRYDPCADQNDDGKVNLVDFSIMMYWWTG